MSPTISSPVFPPPSSLLPEPPTLLTFMRSMYCVFLHCDVPCTHPPHYVWFRPPEWTMYRQTTFLTTPTCPLRISYVSWLLFARLRYLWSSRRNCRNVAVGLTVIALLLPHVSTIPRFLPHCGLCLILRAVECASLALVHSGHTVLGANKPRQDVRERPAVRTWGYGLGISPFEATNVRTSF